MEKENRSVVAWDTGMGVTKAAAQGILWGDE